MPALDMTSQGIPFCLKICKLLACPLAFYARNLKPKGASGTESQNGTKVMKENLLLFLKLETSCQETTQANFVWWQNSTSSFICFFLYKLEANILNRCC